MHFSLAGPQPPRLNPPLRMEDFGYKCLLPPEPRHPEPNRSPSGRSRHLTCPVDPGVGAKTPALLTCCRTAPPWGRGSGPLPPRRPPPRGCCCCCCAGLRRAELHRTVQRAWRRGRRRWEWGSWASCRAQPHFHPLLPRRSEGASARMRTRGQRRRLRGKRAWKEGVGEPGGQVHGQARCCTDCAGPTVAGWSLESSKCGTNVD